MSRHIPMAALATLVLLCSSFDAISQICPVRRSVVAADTIAPQETIIKRKKSAREELLSGMYKYAVLDSVISVEKEKLDSSAGSVEKEEVVIISDTIIVHDGDNGGS